MDVLSVLEAKQGEANWKRVIKIDYAVPTESLLFIIVIGTLSLEIN